MQLEITKPNVAVVLKVVSGRHAGLEIRVPTTCFLIGRGDDCQLRPNSESVSRHHCVLTVRDDLVILQDLNSRNGTLVNGLRIENECPLKTADQIAVGPLKFEVQIAPPAPELPQTDDSDVIDWLREAKQAPHFDTQRMTVADTQVGPVSGAAAGSETTVDSRTDPPAASPTPSAPRAKDSQAAAAEILRQYLKGR